MGTNTTRAATASVAVDIDSEVGAISLNCFGNCNDDKECEILLGTAESLGIGIYAVSGKDHFYFTVGKNGYAVAQHINENYDDFVRAESEDAALMECRHF